MPNIIPSDVPYSGHVLWCLVPHQETIVPGKIAAAASSPHPVLVIKLYNEVSPIQLLVVAGTGSLNPLNPWDFIISSPRDLQEAGLSKATRFKGSSLQKVPFTREYFVPAPSASLSNQYIDTCYLGKLNRQLESAAQAAMGAWGKEIKRRREAGQR